MSGAWFVDGAFLLKSKNELGRNVRALVPAQAAQVVEALRERIRAIPGPALSGDVDDAVSVHLVPLLRALHGPGR